jgi:ammonia channel protein AmtB
VLVLFTLSLSERTTLQAYLVYALVLATVLYPSIVAWVWAGGWLQQKGFHDFAGAGVVHITAGLSGLWGTIFLGRRYGLDSKQVRDEVTEWKQQNEPSEVKSAFNKEGVDMIIKESDHTSRIHLVVEKRIES